MAAMVSRISSSTGSCWPAIGRSAAVWVDKYNELMNVLWKDEFRRE
jgi:hypothetical protein